MRQLKDFSAVGDACGRAFAESRMFCNLHWWSDLVGEPAAGCAAQAAALARADG